MAERGDTIIEVIFAVTVFSMVALGGMALMNQGAAMAQRSLEISMVRDQMDAQADGLRYIHDAYMAGLGGAANSTVARVWNAVASDRAETGTPPDFGSISDGQSCVAPSKAVGVNAGRPYALDITKLDDPAKVVVSYDDDISHDPSNTANYEQVPVSRRTPGWLSSTTYAQIRYGVPPDPLNLNPSQTTAAQGIWIIPVHTPKGTQVPGNTAAVGYYDFNIYACWMTPGQSAPVTLGTVVRLYDPN